MEYLRKYAIIKNHLAIHWIITNFPMNHSQSDVIREHDGIFVSNCQNLNEGSNK
jgi:hypothetical protein